MRFICVSAAVCFLLATTAACDQSRPENEPLTAALTATPFPDLSSPTELAPTPESSETSTPLPTSTSTPLPTETNTPAPTTTPVPTSTDTPKPTQTPTPVLILEQVNEDGFAEPANWTIMSFEEFDGNLYAGTRNHETGCEIWRYDGAQWELLVEDGFGDEHNAAVTSMIVFQDMLYAGTWSTPEEDGIVPGAEIWRSSDGSNWEQVMTEGFGQGDVNAEVDELIIFQDLLYAVIYDGSGEKGLEIWRSATGDPDDWSRVVDDGFGNIENAAIVAHAIYSDRLYVGTFTLTGTAQLYSTSDGLKWDFVNDFNLGNILNRRVTSLEVFNHYLYAAVVEKGELSEMVARVYRCSVCEGDDWEVVLDGPYENTGTFRKPGLKVYRNHLYYAVGNFDAEVEITASRGLELWRTEDGISWERLATEGFGDPNNAWTYFDNAMAVFGDGLYIATDNKVTGVEVWRVAYSQ